MRKENVEGIQIDNLRMLGTLTTLKDIQKKSIDEMEWELKELTSKVNEVYEEYQSLSFKRDFLASDLRIRYWLEDLDNYHKQGYDLNEIHEWLPKADRRKTRWDMIEEFDKEVHKKK